VPATTVLTSVTVPNLIGLSSQEAEKKAYASGLRLEVESDSGSGGQIQQEPPDLMIIRQTPSPNTLVLPGTIIKVTLGRPAKSAAQLFLDRLIPSVYAAEARPRVPKQPQAVATPKPPATVARRPAGTDALAKSDAVASFVLDDDLIYVGCNTGGCGALGRSGRIYKIGANNRWTFKQASFENSTSTKLNALLLVSADGKGTVIAKSDETNYLCSVGMTLWLSDTSKPFVCSEAQSRVVASKNELVLADNQLSSGSPPIFDRWPIGDTNQVDLVVGDTGFIAKLPHDEAMSLVSVQRLPSGTSAALRSIAFISGRGFAVGDGGTILSTKDSGESWQHQTQGQEGAILNRRFPAGWYWITATLLIITCLSAVLFPAAPAATEFSVADWSVTDAPLKPGDIDSLDFTPMALGLSRFIRNRKTQPPITIAIEGEWGQGKSSVMSLLQSDLQKSRFRPVWFNAWHHQSEEQLLAALLEHVKSQGVPPWWHVDNWVFRTRLVRIRFRRKWPVMLALGLAFSASVAYEVARHGVKIEEVTELGHGFVHLIRYLLPWVKETARPDLGHFSLLATMFAIVLAVFEKAKTFGLDPAKLTDNLRKATTIKDVKPDPSIRRQFSREFGDLCTAWSWGGRRVIIFIDDLDRCRPESVVTVLESINFLTSAGDCIIILGMAQNQVTHCVGLGFKDIAEAEEAYRGGGATDQQKAVARFRYGSLYIKKLVNIVAPLPKTTEEQRQRILEMKAAEVRRQESAQKAVGAWRYRFWDSLAGAGGVSSHMAPVLGLVVMVVISVVAGYRQGKLPETAATQISGSARVEPSQSVPQSGTTLTKDNELKPLTYERPTTERATLSESISDAAEAWWSYAIDTLLFLLLFGLLAYQLSARTNQDAQNSPEFEDSLKLWGRYIVGVCETPREIKRTLNDLRYQAMTRRSAGPSITRGERIVRALREFVIGQPQGPDVVTSVDEASLPPRKAAELANLDAQDWAYFLNPSEMEIHGSETLKLLIKLKKEHIETFKRWIDDPRPLHQEARPIAHAAQHGGS
jgi:hypothetical protein